MRHIAHIPLQPYLASLPGRVSLTEGLQEYSAKLADLQDSIEVTDLDGKPVESKPPKERKTAEQFMRDLTEHGSLESWIVSGVLGEKTRDLSRLREPIHKIFANWASSPSDIAVFTKKYGLLEDWLIGETSTSDAHKVGEEWLPYDFEFDVSDWVELQENLRNWWRYRFGPVPEEGDPRRKALLAEVQKVKAERRREKGDSGKEIKRSRCQDDREETDQQDEGRECSDNAVIEPTPPRSLQRPVDWIIFRDPSIPPISCSKSWEHTLSNRITMPDH